MLLNRKLISPTNDRYKFGNAKTTPNEIQQHKTAIRKKHFSRTCFFPHMLVSIQSCIFKGKSIQLPQNEINFEIHSKLDTDQPPPAYIYNVLKVKKDSNYK